MPGGDGAYHALPRRFLATFFLNYADREGVCQDGHDDQKQNEPDEPHQRCGMVGKRLPVRLSP